MESKKPPLGLTPRWLLDEEREREIYAAIDRYNEADYPIPIEWIQELTEIQERLRKFYNAYYHRTPSEWAPPCAQDEYEKELEVDYEIGYE